MRCLGTATLSRSGREWLLEVEPHVAIRLKQLFPRISRAREKVLVVTCTDETCRDLAWLAERYPLDFRCANGGDARAELEKRAGEFDRRAELAQQIRDGVYVPPDCELAVPARSYQLQAAALAATTGHLLLADSVGLGKTVSAIAMLGDGRALPAVVVCPAHLPRQWRREILRFMPGLRVEVVTESQPPTIDVGTDDSLPGIASQHRIPDVLILSYFRLWKWSDYIAAHFRTVVFDECQSLRRKASRKYQGARQIAEAAERVLGLSATPIYNYGYEFHSVMDVLAPDSLGSEDEFLREWCVGGTFHREKARISDTAAFGAYLRDSALMLRRTREDVGRELPPLQRVVQLVDCDEAELDRVKSSATELAKIILSDNAKRFDRMRAGGELDMLVRQSTGIAKAPYVADFVRMLLADPDEKVVLFGWHRAVYDLWAERLKDLEPAWYTGHESPARKAREAERFIEGDARVLIVSLRSGEGLDGLQRASSIVVFGELDWSPGVHEQCTGRVFRDGQPKPVLAYYLTSDTGSDPEMIDVLGVKQAQIDGVRSPEQRAVPIAEVDPNHVRRLAERFLAQETAR